MGEWGELGGLILTNWQAVDFDVNLNNFDTLSLGQDFGFNHANCILLIGFKDDDIYVIKELYCHEMDTNEIIRLAEGKFDKSLPMWCDSAEPDRIKMWKTAGYRAKGVKKSPLKEANVLAGATKKTYITSQIDWIKQRKIFVHPSCVNLMKELSAWKWKKDKTTNKYIDVPVDVFDDAIAALRYGCEDMLHQRQGWQFH